eukprot:3222331-Amphidinium_carterae.1
MPVIILQLGRRHVQWEPKPHQLKYLPRAKALCNIPKMKVQSENYSVNSNTSDCKCLWSVYPKTTHAMLTKVVNNNLGIG